MNKVALAVLLTLVLVVSVVMPRASVNAQSLTGLSATPAAPVRRILGGQLRGGPVYAHSGHWYLSAEDRYLYRLDPGSLETVFRVPLPGRPTDALLLSPWGTAFVGLENGSVVAVSEAGRIIYRIRPESGPALPFALGADGELVLLYPGSRVMRAFGSLGTLLWSITLSEPPAGPAVVAANGDVVVPTRDGRLARVGSGGAVRAPAELGGPARAVAVPVGMQSFWSTAVHDDDVVVVVDNRMQLLGRDAQVRAEFSLPWGDLSGIQQLDSGSFAGLREGGAAVLIRPDQQISVAEGVVWLSSVDGAPLLGRRDGSLTMLLPERGVLSTPPIEEGRGFLGGAQAYGRVMAAAENWGVYALSVPAAATGIPLRGRGWLAPRGDYAATGRPAGIAFRREGPAEWRHIPDFLYLEEALRSDSAVARRELLAELQRRYSPGRAGSDIAYLRYILERLATEAFASPMRRDGIIRNDFPWARATALRLLGTRPDYRLRSFLLRAGATEVNREVRVVLLQQIAAAGIDPDLAGAQLAVRYLSEEGGARPNEAIAVAALQSLGTLRRVEGEAVDPFLSTAYRLVAERNFSRELREGSLRRAREIDQSGIDSYTE